MSANVAFIDVDAGVYDGQAVVDMKSTGVRGDAEWSVRMTRLSGGLSDGVDVVWLDNGCMKLAVVPTRGMGIWKGSVAGTPLGWNSPVERPVHPSFVDPMRRGGIGWLDGFNEIVCRCGLGWHGAPGNDVVRDSDGNIVSEEFLPLHGRIANLAAHRVSVEVSDEGEIRLTGIIDEASMFGGKLRLTSVLSTHIGSNTFELSDTVQNLGAASAEVEMLYHCNFGRPFLEGGSKLHLAAEELAPRDARAAEDIGTWPTYLPPTSGYSEQCYFATPFVGADNRTIAVLTDSSASKAVAVRFDVSTLPCFTVWKNTQAEHDGYCTGLEPGSSFPNLKTFERDQGRVISLGTRDSVTFELSISAATEPDGTSALLAEVDELRAERETKVHSTPNPSWSPQ